MAARKQLLGIEPDLTTLGKIVGGGLPVGAYGGRADMMDHVLPGRQSVSGRHAQRQSAGHRGRLRDAPRAARRSTVRAAGTAGARLEAGLRAAAAAPASRTSSPASAA